jgi:uncharacterized membrane protein
MENKKLGVLFIIISFIFLGFLFYFNGALNESSDEIGCIVDSKDCSNIEKNISMTNMAFGFFGFMLALGIYILFFNKTEEKIMRRLEDEKNQKVNDEKFKYILMALDDYEKKVLKSIREQDGITQNTLRLRTDMSKAKLSYVLQELEKRNLIKRVQKGKTLEVWLKI